MLGNNRKARLDTFKKLGEAAVTKLAQRLTWDLSRPNNSERKVTPQSVGLEAVQVVRDYLNGFVWPSIPRIGFSGLRRTTAGYQADKIDTGVVTVTASIRTPIGVSLSIDIPVEIRNSMLQDPVIMVHSGSPYVISQTSIDKIVGNNSTYGDVPVRGMYDPPERYNTEPVHLPRRTPGPFRMSAAKQDLRDFIRTRGASANVTAGKSAIDVEYEDSNSPGSAYPVTILYDPTYSPEQIIYEVFKELEVPHWYAYWNGDRELENISMEGDAITAQDEYGTVITITGPFGGAGGAGGSSEPSGDLQTLPPPDDVRDPSRSDLPGKQVRTKAPMTPEQMEKYKKGQLAQPAPGGEDLMADLVPTEPTIEHTVITPQFVEKVKQEVNDMRDSDISDIDIQLALERKYPQVVEEVLKDVES